MKLTFSDSRGDQRVLGNFETYEEAEEKLDEFLTDYVHTRYYSRGSWYEFSIIEDSAELEERINRCNAQNVNGDF